MSGARRMPMQPVEHYDGVQRFRPNRIVERLLDDGPFDMNQIAMWDVTNDERVQFAQLIGYSVAGFAELSFVDDEAYALGCLDILRGENAELLARADVLRNENLELRRLLFRLRDEIEINVREDGI